MQKLLYVGIGGFIGACLRYVISLNSAKIWGTYFPYGTLIVNVLGGLLIGIILQLSMSTELIPANLKLFLTTGIMGGLTTFSTFSFETVELFYAGSYGLAVINITLNVVLSLGGVFIGRNIVS